MPTTDYAQYLPTSKLAEELLDLANGYSGSKQGKFITPLCQAAAARLLSLEKRVKWLESLFDFSDPEIGMHHAPNDPITATAVIVRLTDYEAKNTKVKALEDRNKELDEMLRRIITANDSGDNAIEIADAFGDARAVVTPRQKV